MPYWSGIIPRISIYSIAKRVEIVKYIFIYFTAKEIEIVKQPVYINTLDFTANRFISLYLIIIIFLYIKI